MHQPVPKYRPVTGAVDLIFYQRHDLDVGILDHFFTRPEPLQVGHFLYPVSPPVLRVRVRFVIFCLTFAIIQIPHTNNKSITVAGVNLLLNLC